MIALAVALVVLFALNIWWLDRTMKRVVDASSRDHEREYGTIAHLADSANELVRATARYVAPPPDPTTVDTEQLARAIGAIYEPPADPMDDYEHEMSVFDGDPRVGAVKPGEPLVPGLRREDNDG